MNITLKDGSVLAMEGGATPLDLSLIHISITSS